MANFFNVIEIYAPFSDCYIHSAHAYDIAHAQLLSIVVCTTRSPTLLTIASKTCKIEDETVKNGYTSNSSPVLRIKRRV